MATFTAIATGNWNAWSTWFASDPGGGEGSQYPGNGDVADCAGYNITMNLTTTPASGTLAEMKSTGAGCFIWENAAGGAMVVNCTKFSGGATSAGSSGVFRFSATTVDYNLTINTGTGAGNGFIGCSGGTTPYLFVITSSKNCTINGDCIGGSATNAYCFFKTTTGGGTVAITGNVASGSGSNAHGAYMNISGTLNVTGNVTADGGHGVGVAANTVTVGLTDCILTGSGTTNLKNGLYSTLATTLNFSNVTLVNGANGMALMIAYPPSSWTPEANDYWEFSGFKFAKTVAAGDLKSGVVNGDVTGTYAAGGLISHPGMRGGLNG